MDLSTSELADKSNVAKSNLGRYQTGKLGSVVDNLYHLAEALEVDPAWLVLGDSGENHEELDKAIELCRNLPDARKEVLIEVIKVFGFTGMIEDASKILSK